MQSRSTLLVTPAAAPAECTRGSEIHDQHGFGIGVQRAQGFYVAEPMPAELISRLVAAGHCWDVT